LSWDWVTQYSVLSTQLQVAHSPFLSYPLGLVERTTLYRTESDELCTGTWCTYRLHLPYTPCSYRTMSYSIFETFIYSHKHTHTYFTLSLAPYCIKW
jgi:hypothetical protein